jgi:ATP-dependent Lhr-like helicase
LSALEPEWTVVPDNYAVKVRGADPGGAWLDETIGRLTADNLWHDETIWTTVRDSLPNYRLSKFQPLMPDWVEREVLTNYLLDIPATRDWLTRSRRPGGD